MLYLKEVCSVDNTNYKKRLSKFYDVRIYKFIIISTLKKKIKPSFNFNANIISDLFLFLCLLYC